MRVRARAACAGAEAEQRPRERDDAPQRVPQLRLADDALRATRRRKARRDRPRVEGRGRVVHGDGDALGEARDVERVGRRARGFVEELVRARYLGAHRFRQRVQRREVRESVSLDAPAREVERHDGLLDPPRGEVDERERVREREAPARARGQHLRRLRPPRALRSEPAADARSVVSYVAQPERTRRADERLAHAVLAAVNPLRLVLQHPLKSEKAVNRTHRRLLTRADAGRRRSARRALPLLARALDRARRAARPAQRDDLRRVEIVRHATLRRRRTLRPAVPAHQVAALERLHIVRPTAHAARRLERHGSNLLEFTSLLEFTEFTVYLVYEFTRVISRIPQAPVLERQWAVS